jgi:hypothetical protein
VTVLLIAAAASIGYAISRQAALGRRSDEARGVAAAVQQSARSLLGRAEGHLLSDPLAFSSTVLELEASRICQIGTLSGAQFSAGQDWPGSCGISWSYAAPAASWSGARIEVTPPSPAEPGLRLTARVRAADGTEAAYTARYLPAGAGRWTWASTGQADLSSVAPSDSVTVNGALYAATATASPGVNISGVVAAEVFTAAPAAASGVKFFGAAPQPGPEFGNIRQLLPTPLRNGNLGTVAPALQQLACTQGEPVNVTPLLTSAVCVTAGGQLRLANGSLVDVPSDAAAFLVVPDGAGLHLWYSTTGVDLTPGGPLVCTSSPTCSLAAHQEALGADHPGNELFWAAGYLGRALAPVSGIVAVGGTAVIGTCTGYAVAAPCEPLGSSATPGVLAEFPLTLVADTVVVGSPVRSTAAVALVADTQVAVAYWSRSGSESTIEAHLFGAGRSGVPGVTAFPAALADGGSSDPNWAAALTVTGSMTGRNLPLGMAGWRAVTITAADSSTSTPPWLPAVGWGWERTAVYQGAADPAGFNPETIPGLVMWFDAADATQLTLDGTTVAAWTDKSRMNWTATAQGSLRPTWEPSGAVTFDGVDDTLNIDTLLRAGTAPTTVMMVMSGSDGPALSWGEASGSVWVGLDGGLPAAGAGPDTVWSALPIGAGLHIVSAVFSNGDVSIEVDGVPVASGALPFDVSGTTTAIGSRGMDRFSGRIGEVLVYNQALTAYERASLVGHLQARWRLR